MTEVRRGRLALLANQLILPFRDVFSHVRHSPATGQHARRISMPDHSPAFVVRSWFEEVWNKGRADLIPLYLSPLAQHHGFDEAGAAGVGIEGFRPFYERLRAAVPDIHFIVHEISENGSLVASRWSATGTHSGDHLGPKASNRTISVSGMSFVHLEDGKIVEAWNEWDRLGFAMTIGAVAPVRWGATS
jgi:steroid delta-isomerase-like uncharacterized protein